MRTLLIDGGRFTFSPRSYAVYSTQDTAPQASSLVLTKRYMALWLRQADKMFALKKSYFAVAPRHGFEKKVRRVIARFFVPAGIPLPFDARSMPGWDQDMSLLLSVLAMPCPPRAGGDETPRGRLRQAASCRKEPA